jgi:hypothetical protein
MQALAFAVTLAACTATSTVAKATDKPKDAESTSLNVTDADRKSLKDGQTVVAQGITLLPREPRFTTLQTVSLLPNCRPPVVSLTFDRSGSCVDVVLNSTTGEEEIDKVIRNSLFFWRASGAKIDSLKTGEKARVTLRLML